MEISFTEENYLKAIYAISYANAGKGASTNEISEHLDNKAGTVTDMLKRLAEKKLINYQKYKGVMLTTRGEKVAVGIVRKHRLWEVFLLEKLKFRWDEVHDIAEQLEHIKSEELVDRLDVFLGRPKTDPHGDPIPNAKGQFNVVKVFTLNKIIAEDLCFISWMVEYSMVILQYLTSVGLKIGEKIKVDNINLFDRSLSVNVNKVCQ